MMKHIVGTISLTEERKYSEDSAIFNCSEEEKIE